MRILSAAFRKVSISTYSYPCVFTNGPIICCCVVCSCISLNSPRIFASSCLYSLLFSPLSKQCQYRLMVNLSDPKQCSLWLDCVTTRLQSTRPCSAFTCLLVLRWDANMLTDYLPLSLTHSWSLYHPPCLFSVSFSPSHPNFQVVVWTSLFSQQDCAPKNYIVPFLTSFKISVWGFRKKPSHTVVSLPSIRSATWTNLPLPYFSWGKA